MLFDSTFRKKYDRLFLLLGLILLAAAGTLTACGTLEIGLESELEPDAVQLNTTQTTATSEADKIPSPPAVPVHHTPTPSPPAAPAHFTPTPSAASNELGETPSEEIEVTEDFATLIPTPIPQMPKLRIAYAKDNNVWLWSEENGPVALTKNGGVENILISDDGLRIAFRRGGNIWVVNSDGTNERQVTTEADFEDISFGEDLDPYVIAITPYQVVWRPGTHTLFFNTIPQIEGPGLMPTDDLWVADVDSGELTTVLPLGEGGALTMSPDGHTIALSTPGIINLFDTDSYEKRQVHTYTPVITYSEVQYYAQPAWAADSKMLAVAIPPADPMASSDQSTSIWTISLDRPSANLVGHLETSDYAQPLFSPDLNHVIYLSREPQRAPGAAPVTISEIRQDDMLEVVPLREYPFQAEVLGSWSPDGSRFVFAPPFNGTAPRRQIATVAGEVSDVGEAGTAVFQISWIDENRYLFLQSNPRGWNIIMAQLAGEAFVAIDGVIGGPPSFDFDS